MTPIEIMAARIRLRMWNLEVGLVNVRASADQSGAYILEFAHGMPNQYAMQRILANGFNVAFAMPMNSYIVMTPPERWQPVIINAIADEDDAPAVPPMSEIDALRAENTTLKARIAEVNRRYGELNVFQVAESDEHINQINALKLELIKAHKERDAVADENAALKARIAELESQLGIVQALPASEMPNAELKKYNGEAVDIIEIRPPRKMIVNDKYYAFIGVFMDVDGKTEVHAKVYGEVYGEVLNTLVKEYGYSASSFRSSPRKLRAPVGCVLEWNDKVGLKVKEFDKPASVEKAA